MVRSVVGSVDCGDGCAAVADIPVGSVNEVGYVESS